MHILKLIERRFPTRKATVPTVLALLSASLLLLGVGLMFIR